MIRIENRDLQQEHAESAGGRTSPTGPPSLTQNHITVSVHGHDVVIPRVPRKFVNFLRARRSVYREISNMAKLGKIGRDGEVGHPNVLGLHEVLELLPPRRHEPLR